MGVAIAEAALARGASVTLIAAGVAVDLPAAAHIVPVETSAQLRAALLAALGGDDGRAGFDALVMAAAVADFTPAAPAAAKLPRGDGLRLDLVPTPDLVAEIARIAGGLDSAGEPTRRALRPTPVIVGFAAETGSLERAAEKLRRKGLDLLVANDVTEPGSGFGTDTNRVTVFDRDGGREAWPLIPKREVAERLLDRVARALDERDASAQTDPIALESPR
jgi:phosphopantothenoylcysteine decarboxylase/phosphopantothenate--cysteine ligase